MFTLRKTKHIDASHQLTQHDGKCARLHGHTYAITFEVKGDKLSPKDGPKRGMVFDYYDLGVIMKEHVDTLDHQHLNDHFTYPTSEVIAEQLFFECAPLIKMKSVGHAELASVSVSETPTSVAVFTP